MTQRTVTHNFIMNGILTISSFVFPLISYPYVSRILEPDGIGKVSLATSVIAYFNIFAQLGIPVYGIRECAKVRDDLEELSRTAHELLIINLCMSILSYVVFAFFLFFNPKLRNEKPLYVIISLTIILTSVGMEWLYKALEEYDYITIRSIIFKCIAVTLMFCLIKSKDNYILYGALTIVAGSASNVLNLIKAHKLIRFSNVKNFNFTRHFKGIGVFFAMACATTIYTNLDTVMLGFMTTDTDVGYYDTALKVRKVILGLVTSLGAVLLPRCSYYIKNKKWDEFYRISGKALHFVSLVALPAVVFFILFANPSVLVLAGKDFENAALPMRIIMPTVFLVGITNILGIQMLLPLGREKTVLISEIAGAVTDLALNAFLIPIYASAGAAAGTLVAEIVVLIVQIVGIRDILPKIHFDMRIVVIILGLIIATATSAWMIKLSINPLGLLVIAFIAFSVLYGATLFVLKDAMMMEMLHRTKAFLDKLVSGKRDNEQG